MQTVFIFTHLIMIGASSSVLFIGFGLEPKEAGASSFIPATRLPHFLNWCKALGCGMKAQACLLSANMSRLKIINRFARRSRHGI